MNRLFISHSSANNTAATALKDWLRDNGWDDVFLDTDPERGIAAGERWERKLNEAASRCEAVIFVISQAWLASPWCGKEFNLARRLNKRLFGVLVEDVPVTSLPEPLTGAWQVVNLATGVDHEMFRVILPNTQEETHVTFSREGLKRLRAGLKKAGLDPLFFDWPPKTDADRSPYPGLKPLEAADAGIFFGRDAPVIEALDSLRGLRDAAAPRIAVILGASGSGKSSFLRAGILPRLARDDRNFLPLPVIRPQRAAINGETGLISALDAALAAREVRESRAAIRAAVQGGAATLRPLLVRMVETLFRQTLAEEGNASQPAVILAIDQAEELFSEDGRAEGAALLDLARQLVAADEPAVVILFAIRSDSYDRLERASSLEGLRQNALPLLPMPRGNYHTVIEEPARRLAESGRALTIDPRLTETLLADIEKGGGSDALPLLAFTLEQLYVEYGRGNGRLRLADYQNFGGVGGAIEAAVARALAAADGNPGIPAVHEARLALLRRGLIPWLAGIDPETGSPRRRVARLADVPAESIPLIDLLIAQRLLATDRIAVRDGEAVRYETTIEPAHEALLRQWGLLRGWLQEDFAALTTLEAVKTAARDWAANNYAPDWLNHSGGRLEDAEAIAARPDLASDLSADAKNYLRRCRERDEETRKEREEALAREEKRLAEIATAQARTARLQRIFFISLGAAILAITLVGGAVFWEHARLQSSEASLSKSEADLTSNQIALADSRTNLMANLARAEQEQGNTNGAFRLAALAVSVRLSLPNGGPLPTLPGFELAEVVTASSERFILNGHKASVNSAAFSPDGTRIVTASGDDTARVWNAATGKLIVILRGHTGAVNTAVFSRDGNLIVTASNDKTARVWSAGAGQQIALLHGHTDSVNSAVFSPDGSQIVTASSDHTARVWDANTGQKIKTLPCQSDWLQSAAFSPDGKRIITASSDGTTRIWDAATGRQIADLGGSLGLPINWVDFSPDGTRIAAASIYQDPGIWDVGSGQQIAVLKGLAIEPVDADAFSPDGTRFVTTFTDDSAKVWNTSTGQQIAVLTGSAGRFNSVAFSPNGGRIVMASDDHMARVWNANTGQQIAVLQGHTDLVTAAAFSPDNSRIVTASRDDTARVWDPGNGLPTTVLQGSGTGVSDLLDRNGILNFGIAHLLPGFPNKALSTAAISPDGSRIVTASGEGDTARIWYAATGEPILDLHGHANFVTSATFNLDGSRIVTASWDQTARVWDARTGKSTAVLRGHVGPVISALFSPDGSRIVTASWDGTARVWDTATGRSIAVLQGHTDLVNSAVFSPNGTRIVTASSDNTARVWDAATGQQIVVLHGHTDQVYSAAFSPDGTRIVTASRDDTARVWDAATGQQIAVLQGHTGIVNAAAFSPDGMMIVTASSDNTARVWDAATGQQMALLQGHTGLVNSAVFSPDGTRIVTAADDHTARVWDAGTGQQIAVLHSDSENVVSAYFSPDSTRVVTASDDATARVWDVHFATMPSKALITYVCTHQLLGISTLTRDEMNLVGYPDTTPLIDVCAGMK